MKLYKFRPLATQEDFNRAKNILETGCFWCSKFSELNDPMEGAFHSAEIKIVNETFAGKNCRKICSFSGGTAFKDPILWGYYANGFRGIAIEVECDEKEVEKINYKKYINKLKNTNINNNVKKVLTTKLESWELEEEYRFLIESVNHFHKIGEIKNIYFGDPYYSALNKNKIYEQSDILKKYKKYKNDLIKLTQNMNVGCHNVTIYGTKVKIDTNYL